MKLKEQIENCSRCPLRAKLNEFEKPVFGVGSNKPKVMIVIDNNTSESSFLIDGFNLEYLEKNLTKYKINKSDLYITPLVKCSRKATIKSFKECQDWLQKEVEEFKPKAVIIISAFNINEYSFLAKNGVILYKVSLTKLANSTSIDKKYTDAIFSAIKGYCA